MKNTMTKQREKGSNALFHRKQFDFEQRPDAWAEQVCTDDDHKELLAATRTAGLPGTTLNARSY